MIVLDTNVVSAIMSPTIANSAADWIDAQARTTLWLTATVVAELSSGIEQLPEGRRRATLAQEFESIVTDRFSDRVFSFNTVAAIRYGQIVAKRRRVGRPISIPDAQIAAVCLEHGATLATRNMRDFDATGISVVDPWTGTSR